MFLLTIFSTTSAFGSDRSRPSFCSTYNKLSIKAVEEFLDISRGLANGSFKISRNGNMENQAQFCLVQIRLDLSENMLLASPEEYGQFFKDFVGLYNNRTPIAKTQNQIQEGNNSLVQDRDILFSLIQGLQFTWMDSFAMEYMRSSGNLGLYTASSFAAGFFTLLVFRSFYSPSKLKNGRIFITQEELTNRIQWNRDFALSLRKMGTNFSKEYLLPRLSSFFGVSVTNTGIVFREKKKSLLKAYNGKLINDTNFVLSMRDYPAPFEYFEKHDFSHMTHEDYATLRGVVVGAFSAPIGIEVAEFIVGKLNNILSSTSKVVKTPITVAISSLLASAVYEVGEKAVNFGSDKYLEIAQDKLRKKIEESLKNSDIYNLFSYVDEHVDNVLWNVNIRARKFFIQIEKIQYKYLYDMACNSWGGLLSVPFVPYGRSNMLSAHSLQMREDIGKAFSQWNSNNGKRVIMDLFNEWKYIESMNKDFFSESVLRLKRIYEMYEFISKSDLSTSLSSEIFDTAKELLGTNENGEYLIDGGLVTPERKQEIITKFNCPELSDF